MLMLKIANYLNGIVRIRIAGAVPEKFINLCLARKIALWNITKSGDGFLACVRLGDFFRIRPLTRISRTQVRVVGFAGLPFVIKRIKRRKLLVAGAVLFFVLLNLLSSYIWFIDVAGSRMVSSEQIRTIASKQGLKPGAPKDRVDVKAVESGLLVNLPELAWVGINLTGTRAVIEVVEKTTAKPEDKSPANVFAAKDGIITEIIVIAGQAAVNKGDTVKKGDLLIKGLAAEPLSAEPEVVKSPVVPPEYIRAKGIIKARVWYEGYGEAGLNEEKLRATGREVFAVTLVIGSTKFSLKRAPDQPFDRFEVETVHKKLPEWRNSGFTVESTIDIYREIVAETYDITAEQARDLARTRALQTVQDLIPEAAEVLYRQIEILQTAEPAIVRAKVMVEAVEDIGQTMSIIP